MLKFTFRGQRYVVDLEQAQMLNRIVLPAGQLLQVKKWGLLDPPVILELEEQAHSFAGALVDRIARLMDATIAFLAP